MTALPMLTRCFAAQWNGLTEEEREYQLRRDHPGYVSRPTGRGERPLWMVMGPVVGGLILLSLKDD